MAALSVTVRTALALLLASSVLAGAGCWVLTDRPGAGATRIDSCTTITEPGRYVVVDDVVDGDATTCFSVESSDVILDGNGHRIDGRGTFGTAGVVVRSGRRGDLSNVTVRDLQVSDWDDGVRYVDVAGGRLASARVTDSRVGISLVNSRGVTVVDNVARSNRLRGIALHEESANNTLANNTAAGNDLFGIHLVEPGVRNNTLVGNTASDNEYGIVLVGAADNDLTRNEADGNRIAGIWLSAAAGNDVARNAVSNRFYGVFLSDRSNGNVVSNNVADANAVGVRLRSSDDNAVVDNVVRASSDTAILLISSDRNRVVGNVGPNNARGLSRVRSEGNVVANNSVG